MSFKNPITGSTTETRVRHLIHTGAFTSEMENVPEESLVAHVTRIVEDFELEQKDAVIRLVPRKITVSKLINTAAPRRGTSNYPDFSDHTTFPVVKASGKKHFVLMDHFKGIFAYRFPIPLVYIDKLEESDSILPSQKSRAEESNGQQRGGFTIREYSEWADFSQRTYMTNSFKKDQPHSGKWKEMNQPLFEYCSNILKQVAPDQWIAMGKLRYTEGRLDKGQKGNQKNETQERIAHVAGIWPGVAINQRQTKDGETHWDFKDGRGKFNLAIPFGQDGWEGGYLVLWQLQLKIQVSRGEGLLFLGSNIAHNVVDITSGIRNSLDLFCHQSNFDARRTQKIRENRTQNWNSGATVQAKERKKKNGLVNRKKKRKLDLDEELDKELDETGQKHAEDSKARRKAKREFDNIDELNGEVDEGWISNYKKWKAEQDI